MGTFNPATGTTYPEPLALLSGYQERPMDVKERKQSELERELYKRLIDGEDREARYATVVALLTVCLLLCVVFGTVATVIALSS
jgi:hypothetical protein